MRSQKHLPATILGLTIFSAALVLVGGWYFARVEKRLPIEKDQAQLTNFTSALLREIQDLESLYRHHLDDIRVQFLDRGSQINLGYSCRNIVGIEQASILSPGRSSFTIDLREEAHTESLPPPHLIGSQNANKSAGFIVDPGVIKKSGRWIKQPGRALHYAARLNNERILVLSINTKETSAAMDEWLGGWMSTAFQPVEVSGIRARVTSPLGTKLANSGEVDEENPSLLLPVQCALGRWHIAAWDEFQTTVSYRPTILIGSVALAIFLAGIGLFGYIQQNRAFHLAEQRVSFVNRVSHELRTPMTNILLNLDLLADSISDKKPRTEKSLGLIRDETERLSRLLANVLTFSSRGQEKKISKVVSCDMKALTEEVVDQFNSLLNRKGITTIFSPPLDEDLYALGDPDAIRQIIGNLVSNIEKYGPVNQPFEIALSSKNQQVSVAITDAGPGIKATRRSQIFKPFVRLDDSTTEGVSGTGLGLAIARDLAEAMGGSLIVQSPPPGKSQGSRFELVLPESGSNVVSIAS